MIPKEIEGKTPDTVMTASDGRRIELYGKPSTELLAQAVCRELVKRTDEKIRERLKEFRECGK